MKKSYLADPGLLPAVLDVLGTVFGTWFTDCESIARARGLRWEECSTPFVVEKRGRVVAHVGVLELPLVLDGVERVVAGVHAVATHPDHRGRGLMRRAMEAALAYCDARYETAVLTTGDPAIYEPFGFRTRTEHRFVCEASPPTGVRSHVPFDRGSADHLGRLLDVLARRTPVSRRLGVRPEKDVFLFDTALVVGLQWFDDLDLLAWMLRDGATLRIYDLVAPRIPPLADFLARMDGPIDRVETYFAPDLLDAAFVAEPCLFDGDEYFMTRGPFLPADVAITLPRTARC